MYKDCCEYVDDMDPYTISKNVEFALRLARERGTVKNVQITSAGRKGGVYVYWQEQAKDEEPKITLPPTLQAIYDRIVRATSNEGVQGDSGVGKKESETGR